MVFAYNKRLPSSWNFHSVGRSMDELGNFGHVSVPIMEGPGHCLRLKNSAFFSITIGSADLPYDELFYKFLLFWNAQYCNTFGRFHWFLLFYPFFSSAGHLSTSRIHWSL